MLELSSIVSLSLSLYHRDCNDDVSDYFKRRSFKYSSETEQQTDRYFAVCK